MNYSEDSEFRKELKRFSKKWRSLPGDLDAAKSAIEAIYNLGDDHDAVKAREAFFNGKRATVLCKFNTSEVVKMRLDCVSLGNKELVRLIFIFMRTKNEIIFIEIYAKNEKTREDEGRIRRYIK